MVAKKIDKDFHSFYLLREHKRKEHGAQRGSSAQNADVTQRMGDVDDNGLKENLETCKLFWWTVRWRMPDTDSATLPWSPENLLEKLVLCLTVSYVQLS